MSKKIYAVIRVVHGKLVEHDKHTYSNPAMARRKRDALNSVPGKGKWRLKQGLGWYPAIYASGKTPKGLYGKLWRLTKVDSLGTVFAAKKPLFWTEQDAWAYMEKYPIPIGQGHYQLEVALGWKDYYNQDLAGLIRTPEKSLKKDLTV